GLRYQTGSKLPLTIVRHEVNLGYGGNQKTGYQLALEQNLDLVVLLHGDGQYAPEYLPQMVEPIVAGRADVVFGSRMLTQGGARKGGMPLYKFVGNKILTFLQNRLARVSLSEWHSGYRAYSVPALRKVNFLKNSDYFDFDSQIILQMIGARQRIVEIEIPTFYGDEISRVNGINYGIKILLHTLKFRLTSNKSYF
ncbi:MAG: glycosyltransferase family 2 protein, partial [Actinomycetota bacterium]